MPMPRLSKRIEPRELAEPLAVPAELRELPADLQVRVGTLRVDEIDRAVAHDAVCDVDVAAPGKAHFGHA